MVGLYPPDHSRLCTLWATFFGLKSVRHNGLSVHRHVSTSDWNRKWHSDEPYERHVGGWVHMSGHVSDHNWLIDDLFLCTSSARVQTMEKALPIRMLHV
jgi:hypothetical protein